ncbi:TonB-dependent receptor [Dasania sp. GY-MA-18]|uniref:TonB-dependent receptor n=1 Tax=Dasania phycosphaerae TaxID=2950436 RepID=A0A9J6RK12_9GAMM|nr:MULTISPECIES: TonB-dependent receptor [Dasania]MCR8922320.1 TonB-dependent receptor [Dasania sp. GY-MA-18]MCZ0864748.1 TonB-dependent receptor [Dasania phycosphaerae]MCZ0868476.1 TonB-dependent receptor [Dasania phycosphaerae]
MHKLNVSKALLPTLIAAAASSVSYGAPALEEVMVTATKRSASIQDIPLSISAVSGESLAAAGIQDFDDLIGSVPSLSMKSSGPGRTKLNIRGISAATGFAPTVSYYIDEMPISSISSGSSTSFAQTVISPKLFDLDRVEVLRGPQGTLFGSSSMGGTVRLITGQPNLAENEGKIAGEVSSTKDGGLNQTLNGMYNHVFTDKLALRVVGSITDNSGYIDRVYDDGAGNSGKVDDVNTEETESLRASLRYQLTDDTYIQPAYFNQTMEMDGKPNYDGPGSDDSQIRPFNAAEPFEDEFTMTSLTINSDFDGVNLLINLSKMDREFINSEDMTDAVEALSGGFSYSSPTAAAFVDETVSLKDETFEVRLSSNGDSNFQWVAGIYNKDAEVNSDYVMQRGFEYVTNNGLANTNDRSTYDESAIFGEINYTFAEQFTLTLGLRSLDYDFAQHKEDWGLVYGDTTLSEANLLDVNNSDEETNYRVTLAWDFSDAGQVFVTSSDATRPGGGNRSIPRSTDSADVLAFACNNDLNDLGISGNPTSYAGDKVENLELGLKLDPSDRLRVNASVYHLKWTDIQQRVNTSGACGFNFTANVGEAVSQGIEAEVNFAVLDNLTINAGISYTDAEFTEDTPAAGIMDGDQLADVPEITANLSIDWSMPLEQGEMFVLAGVSYVDDSLEIAGDKNTDVTAFTIESGNVKPSYTIVDLRVGYNSGKNWEAAFFVDNLTDEEAIFTYNDAIVFNLPNYDRTVRNRPRTMGVSASYNF